MSEESLPQEQEMTVALPSPDGSVEVPPVPAPEPPKGSPPVTRDLAEAFAIFEAAGMSAVELGKEFNLKPETVRRALQRVPESTLKQIAKVVSLEAIAGNRLVHRKVIGEILTRDLSERDEKGRHLVSLPELSKMSEVHGKAMVETGTHAGLGVGGNQGMSNPLAAFFNSERDIAEVVDSLDEGVRMKLEIEVTRTPRHSGAVDADFSEVEEANGTSSDRTSSIEEDERT